MPKVKTARKQLFKAALALAGMTQDDFARVNGITVQHLYLVLNRKRISDRLTAKVDEFVREHLYKHTAEVA